MNESGMANINNSTTQSFGKLEQFQLSMVWNNYKERMEFYFEANGITNEMSMRAIFLSCVGESTYETIRSLLTPLTPKDCTFYEIVEKLDGHFHPKPNEIVQRFTFHKRGQKKDETIADFVKDLRKLSEHCNFMELDNMLRDQIVCGVTDKSLQKRLFSEQKLDFKRAYEIAIAHEAAQRHVMDVRGNMEVMAVSSSSKKTSGHGRCFRCEGNHFADKCFFKDKNCDFCHMKGHSSRACFKKRASVRQQQNVHVVQDGGADNEATSCDNQNYLYELNTIQTSSTHQILTKVSINRVEELYEVDLGAACTVISEATWNRINRENIKLTPSTITLQTWSKEKLHVLGSTRVNIIYNNKEMYLPVLVIAGGGRCLLGRDWFSDLGITVQGVCAMEMEVGVSVMKKFQKVFSEKLGAYNGPPMAIELVPGAKPIFLKHRQCPIAWKPAVEREIAKLVEQGILEPVLFSKWATPIVPVSKSDGSIRICGDYRSTVNSVIKTNSYPLPLFSEVMAAIAGGRIFTKLDLQQAYQQLVVDDFSAELLTLNTHKGLFRVRRLPFGISAAPGYFQKCMDTLLIGIDGVKAYLDDIIISGKNEEDHIHKLEKVLEKLLEANLTVNKPKCLFARRELDFLGFHISGKGISPNKEKVKAIQSAATPENKQMLQSFLGLLNFYNAFLPQKATVAEKLHRLLDKNVKWEWTNDHQTVFDELKALLDSETLLIHYDATKPLVLACDASPYGVGVILAHRDEKTGVERPIAFGSRTLGVHERNYAQLDKEALAVIYGIKHFHQYVAGRDVIILTDHKPLLGIFNRNKQIPQMVSPRMLRWCLLLSAYDYKIEYRPGSKHTNADCLSRLPQQSNVDSSEKGPSDILMLESDNAPVKAEQIAAETLKDPVMSRVLRCLLHGWPKELEKAEEFVPYLRRKTELSTHKGCLLWGSRLIVPPKYQTPILELLHGYHTGISVMKSYVRSYVWWPKLDQQIELRVLSCTQCQTNQQNMPSSAPRQFIPSSEKLWSTLHLDFAGPFQGYTFLVVVDAMSKWLEVKIVRSMASAEIINKLREIIATHGQPQRIMSDNGAAFVSAEMQQFYIANGIKYNTAAPYHPSSNGQAERMVRYLKTSLMTLKEGDMHTRLQRILFKQHTTPNTTTGRTPAELLMGRRLRTVLDIVHPDDGQLTSNPIRV